MRVDLNKLKNAFSQQTFGMTKQKAIQQGICIDCKKPPMFYTELGMKEYYISGLCEPCFDRITKDYHD